MTISELIAATDTNSDRLVSHLRVVFADSQFGIMVAGIPRLRPGTRFKADESMTMEFVTDQNGKSMIKVCADPDIFEVNYPGCINALISGRDVVNMALKLADTDGVLICSATSFRSFPIYRSNFEKYVSLEKPGLGRKWWQFWR